jgi:hypothetical protein
MRAADAAAELQWLVPELSVLPLAARRCLVRNPLNGAAAELESGEYAVLSACEGCLSLDEHEARAMHRLSAPPEHRAAFRELLERCARSGLFMSLRDLASRLGPSRGVQAPPFAGLVVRTCERPQQLRRMLRSAAAMQERLGVSYPWHVIDDSRSDDSRRANQEALRECHSVDSSYHGSTTMDALALELKAAHPDLAAEIPALIAAGRDGEATYGRPLNYAALRFAGYRLLLLDDDVVLEPRSAPFLRDGIDVGTSPEAAFWYETFDEASAACPPFEGNTVEAHLRWLGLPLAHAWAQAERDSGGLRIGELHGDAADRFAPDARVLVTRSGLLGDPGWASFSAQRLLLAENTRTWLANHPDAVRYAFESQTHWRGPLSIGFVPRMLWSIFMGLDNSRVVPPALRAAAGEDVVFAEAAACVHPHAWTIEFPFALPHLREQPRHWLTPRDKHVLEPARFLVEHARAHGRSIAAEDPVERMTRLGELFLDLARASDVTLDALLEEQALDYSSALLFGVREQLDAPTLPAAWKSALAEWLDSPTLKLDGASLRASIPAAATVRELAREYGHSLIAWPRLWSYRREQLS